MYENALKEDLIRVVEDLDSTVENERVSRNERDLEKQKIELAKLQLEQLEKEVELQTAKNKALSLNPAAKVEEKQKVNSFESLCDLIISDKLFETLNKETATHIGIRESDWFRPIDLAKECDIYISSRSGSRKETPITLMDIPKTPLKIDHETLSQRDCEKRFKLKESNSHIRNRKNANTLKVESEKQNDEFAQLQYVNVFVENQPVTALIDSGCQIPVLNSSLIRVNKPSEEMITLSSCFGEKRMVEVSAINISLTQRSPSLSVRTAISPTLTEEFIIHPSVYAEIKKVGHAKSDVLLNESGSSLGADSGAYSNTVVSFSNVIENSSYDLPYVKNFNAINDLSSLIKNYKCYKIKSTKLEIGIIREKCSDIVLCKKVNGAMKKSSVESNSRSPNLSPTESKHRRFSFGLHGNTAADSVQSGWPDVGSNSSRDNNAVFARRRSKSKPEQKLLDIRKEQRKKRQRCASRRYRGHIIQTYLLE
ncbi:hypothetical protein TNCV_1776101 [Trichonephila clavipes]|nr:hypothetical protein TNCV_1776101 [Trichonephila clavipes]